MDIKQALRIEHPCTDNTCAIAEARRIGAYLWAAHLLSGATECPNTEAALAELRARHGDEVFDEALEMDRQGLLAQPHATCRSCESTVYGDEWPAECGCCGASVESEDGADARN